MYYVSAPGCILFKNCNVFKAHISKGFISFFLVDVGSYAFFLVGLSMKNQNSIEGAEKLGKNITHLSWP